MSYPFFQINPFFLLFLMMFEELQSLREQLLRMQQQRAAQPRIVYYPKPQPVIPYRTVTKPLVIRQPTVSQARRVYPAKKPVMVFRTPKKTFLGV